jgi:hypothetical protein
MMPRYEIETKYGKLYVKPFDTDIDTINIETEDGMIFDIEHNGMKYTVSLQGSLKNETWGAMVGFIHQIEPEHEKYTQEETVAEMSTIAYLEGYFTEILQNWVRNHPTEMQQSQKAQDQEAIDTRMAEMETLELEIKKIREEVAQITNGNHLSIYRDDGESDNED